VPVRPSVCTSQAGVVSKRLDGSSWFRHGGFLTYPTLCNKEIWVSPKQRIIYVDTLSRTLKLENLATASQSCCEPNSSTVELVDHTCDGRRAVAGRSMVYTHQANNLLDVRWPDRSVINNPITAICCTTCSYSCAAVDKISTDTARRAVPLRQQSFSLAQRLQSADLVQYFMNQFPVYSKKSISFGTTSWTLPIFFLVRHGTSIVANVVNLVRSRHICHTEHSHLLATSRTFCSAGLIADDVSVCLSVTVHLSLTS